ncbi:MAG TPA: hypothetical protein VFD71_04375 [Planctomycetota bacterium]|nr:hypothetical protein [Planctomycetota bacterium]
MDKLKQNSYWIAVGATCLVLLAAAYFLVVAPLGELSAKQEELNARIDKVDAALKRKDTVSKKLKAWLVEKNEADNQALEKGKEFYDAQGKPFDLYFNDAEAKPAVNEFSATYTDELKKLVEGYQQKFSIQPNAEDPTKTLPVIEPYTAEALNDENIPMAMKEFWVTEEIIKACEKLELGGLQSLKFPGRTDTKVDPLPYNRRVRTEVLMSLPAAKIEDLLSELFASQRVLFEVEKLEYSRTQDTLARYATLIQSDSYKDPTEAAKSRYEDKFPDPPVALKLDLWAFDYTGVPVIKEEAPPPAEAEPKKKTSSSKKAPKS